MQTTPTPPTNKQTPTPHPPSLSPQGLLSHTGPATWVPYLITGFSQVVLIAQVIFYWVKNKDGPCCAGKPGLADADGVLPELRSTEELTGLIGGHAGHIGPDVRDTVNAGLDEFAEADLAYLGHGESTDEEDAGLGESELAATQWNHPSHRTTHDGDRFA
jgi:hypothetical protein